MPPQPVVAAGVTAATHVALSPSRTHVEPWVSSGPPCPQVLALPSAGQGGDSHPPPGLTLELLPSLASGEPAVQVETPGS